MINIYESTETTFTHNGLATLQPSRCIVSEKLNGEYQLDLEHPIDAEGRWKHLAEDNLLRAPTPEGDDLFRIYKDIETLSRIPRVQARHLSYDLLTDLVINNAPTDATATAALQTALQGTGFTGTSDVSGLNSVRWVRKNRLACILGDEDNSIVSRWGGEAYRRQRRFDMQAQRGMDRGVSIRYRKNLTGLELERDVTSVITRVMPTGLAEDGQTVLSLPEIYVDSPLIGNYFKPKEKHIHYGDIRLGEEGYETEEDVYAALHARVMAEYDAGLDKPTVSGKISFVDLSQTTEYKHYRQLERIHLGDTVHIWHADLGIDTTARIVGYTWDALLERYISLEIGQPALTISAMIKQQNQQLLQQTTQRSDALQAAIDEATGIITSPGRSYVRFLPSLSNPAEILIMDAPDPETASNVMRFNQAGWGLSTTGINGPYATAATALGIVADSITTGLLNADKIVVQGTGTYFDGSMLRIEHSQINGRLEASPDGLKLYEKEADGSYTVIGGLFKIGNRIVMASNRIVNPLYPAFATDIGWLPIGEIGIGLDFLYNEQRCGMVGPASTDGTNMDMFVVDGRPGTLWLTDKDNSVPLSGVMQGQIAWGRVNVVSNQTIAVQFPAGRFGSAPMVVASYSQTQNVPTQGDNSTLYIGNITATGFNIRSSPDTVSKNATWIAVGN